MSAQKPQLQLAVILLFRSAPPFVLYPDDADSLYDELQGVIRNAQPGAPKLIEKLASGPIRKVCFIDTELIGVSVQMGLLPSLPTTG
ncbi:MAG: hypothetical protein U0003_01805 [Vampirovibrionales bacterium]